MRSVREWNVLIIVCLSLLGACNQSGSGPSAAHSPGDHANSSNQTDSAIGIDLVPEYGTAQDVNYLTVMAMPDVLNDTMRISVDSNGQQSNANSINGSITADGRFVVFDSIASNLVEIDANESWDIFLRDRLNETTIRLSEAWQGGDSDGASIDPVISDDGTVVVFSSSATNLVDNDSNQVADIFLVNLLNGSVLRISVNQIQEEANNDSDAPDVSADGRFIVYESNATNLSATVDNNNATDIFLFDSLSGSTEVVSINSVGEQGNGISRNPSVSDDGRFVVFESQSSNLVNDDTNNASDIFMRDRELGITYRVSVGDNGEQANDSSATAMINAEGTVVVFQSTASNLVENDLNNVRDIFIRDLANMSTSRVNVSSNGDEANASTYTAPTMDASGRYIAFYSSANNLVDNDNNNAWDIFLHDRERQETTLVSVNAIGQQGNASSFIPALSAGGHYVVFGSGAQNLVPEDTNESWDIFAHVIIQPNRAPIADAGEDRQIFLGESITLNGGNSSDSDMPIPQLTYRWNIESAPVGSSATITSPESVSATFVPDLLGDYIVSLVVNDGDAESVPDEILVRVVENMAPEAVINTSTLNGAAPLVVEFNAVNSNDPEGAPLLYHWDFNDPESLQNSSSEAFDTHIFNQPGQFNVTLTVTDDFGQIDHATVVINVEAPETPNSPPTVQPVASPSTGTVPLIVNFTANAVDEDGDDLSYAWDFADGSMSNEENPVHEFMQEGVYDVTVTVSDMDTSAQGTVRVTVGGTSTLVTQFIKLYVNTKKPGRDKVLLKASFDAPSTNLVAEDVVRITVNQSVLLEQPFGAFEPGDDTAQWIFRDKYSHVKLDLAHGYIKLFKNKTNMSALEADQPVTVQLALGRLLGSEQVRLQVIGNKRCQTKIRERHHGKHESERDKHCGKDIIEQYFYKATGGYASPVGHDKDYKYAHDEKSKDRDGE